MAQYIFIRKNFWFAKFIKNNEICLIIKNQDNIGCVDAIGRNPHLFIVSTQSIHLFMSHNTGIQQNIRI